MDWTSAPITEDAPLEPAHRRFLPAFLAKLTGAIEGFLDKEKGQLPLWLTVAFGGGIAGWLWLPGPRQWQIFALFALALAAAGLSGGRTRLGRAIFFAGLALAAGCALIWWRSETVAQPRLDRPLVATFVAQVERVEVRAARGDLRLTLRPLDRELAAVTAIIALLHWQPARNLLMPREEGFVRRSFRSVAGLFATGVAVELALTPLALYHFHKAGLYGVLANLIAIPLTTFVVMPLEALALLFDTLGLGAPFWWATGWTINVMLDLAHRVGHARGAVAMLPSMPRWAFAPMLIGGLWICLWTSRVRVLGAIPALVGAIGAMLAPVPTLLVTAEGGHVAVVGKDGVPLLLRSRSGDFVRDLISEAAAYDGEPANLDEQRFARCSRDSCIADIRSGSRAWRLLAIRTVTASPGKDWFAPAPMAISSLLIAACRGVARRAGSSLTDRPWRILAGSPFIWMKRRGWRRSPSKSATILGARPIRPFRSLPRLLLHCRQGR